MATNPVFAVTPRIGSANISVADSSYTSPTSFATVISGGSNGTRISEIVVKCAATSAAGIVRIFLYDGSNYRLFDEIVVSAATGSATVSTNRVFVGYTSLILPSSNWSLVATTSVSQSINVIAFGADL